MTTGRLWRTLASAVLLTFLSLWLLQPAADAVDSQIATVSRATSIAQAEARKGSNVVLALADAGASTIDNQNRATFQHRLTLESGVPVSTTDQTSKTFLYLTPGGNGNAFYTYDNSAWTYHAAPEFGGSLGTLTSGKNYDSFNFHSSVTPSSTNTSTDVITVGSPHSFLTGAYATVASTVCGLTAGTNYWLNVASSTTFSVHSTLANAIAGSSKVDLTSSCTAALSVDSLSFTAWTNDTTRATAITQQDGIYTLSGSPAYRYNGTFRTTSTTTTEDSKALRGLYSFYNRASKKSYAGESSTYTYSTATFREAHASTANRFYVLDGIGDMTLTVRATGQANVATPGAAIVGVGLDSTTTSGADVNGYFDWGLNSGTAQTQTFWVMQPGLGFHYLSRLEEGNGGGTTTWYLGTIQTIVSQ